MIQDTRTPFLDHMVSSSIELLYECTSNQNFSVLLVSLACSLIIGHVDSSSPGMIHLIELWWTGHRYCLFRCSLQEQWHFEWICPGKELDYFCSLMNTIFRNLRISLSVPSPSAWAAGSDSALSGIPELLLKIQYIFSALVNSQLNFSFLNFFLKSVLWGKFTSGNTAQDYTTFSRDQLL